MVGSIETTAHLEERLVANESENNTNSSVTVGLGVLDGVDVFNGAEVLERTEVADTADGAESTVGVVNTAIFIEDRDVAEGIITHFQSFVTS